MFARTAPSSGHGRSCRPPLLLAGSLALALTSGCDYPTDLPALDTRWVVPTEETRFGVDELLPGSVSLTPDLSAFVVDFDPVTFAESLGTLCAACALANGQNVPKPPFLGQFSSAVAPSSLVSVTADIRKRVSGGLEFGPDFHAGVGAELRALSFLPLRAHAGVVSGGMQIGGGASLVLGPVNLTGAGAYRSGDAEDAVLGMLTLSFGAN
jgi:hypothetical protein